jgi:hypothetical protein
MRRTTSLGVLMLSLLLPLAAGLCGCGAAGNRTRCIACNSTGKCPDCDGTGKQWSFWQGSVRCGTCKGNGRCQRCGGWGVTP